MSAAPVSNSLKLERLRKRAHYLEKARAYLRKKGLFEVDCPLLSPSGHIDPYIDLIATDHLGSAKQYLRSSPEYPMKRLLALGFGDCFQLSHVFRRGEAGDKHNPEFTMAEWYRLELTLDQLIEETLGFCSLFVALPSSKVSTYREVFLRYLEIDPFKVEREELFPLFEGHRIPLSSALKQSSKLDLLQMLFALLIEPLLGQNGADIITEFPEELSELAKVEKREDRSVALRFEVYIEGTEIANGYDELTCPVELKRRWERAAKLRLENKKQTPPFDQNLLNAMEKGLPKCCGVAVGFDRLMMLATGAKTIGEILPFTFDQS